MIIYKKMEAFVISGSQTWKSREMGHTFREMHPINLHANGPYNHGMNCAGREKDPRVRRLPIVRPKAGPIGSKLSGTDP